MDTLEGKSYEVETDDCGLKALDKMTKKAITRKTRLLLCTITAAMLALLAGAGLAFQNEPEGFRDLKWRDPPTEEMVLLMQCETRALYTRWQDKLDLGDAKLVGISYYFFDGRFFSVYLPFVGKENYSLLETTCKEKFGEPTEKGFYELVWLIWSGSKAMIVLSYDTAEKVGYLRISSIPLFEEYMEDRHKREIEKASENQMVTLFSLDFVE